MMISAEDMRKKTLRAARVLPKYEQRRTDVLRAIERAAADGCSYVDVSFLNVRNAAIIEELRDAGYCVKTLDGALHRIDW